LQASKRASKKALGLVSFTNSCESFAWFDPSTSSWKTYQQSFLTDLTLYLGNWPKQGLMRNGRAYRQVLWAPAIKEIGGGLLPTPRAQEPGSTSHTHGDSVMERVCLKMGVPTKKYPNTLPTPVARDWKGVGRVDQLPTVLTPTGAATYLNPSFVEEMMGFPIGWSALKP
jgi:hypothetical protein